MRPVLTGLLLAVILGTVGTFVSLRGPTLYTSKTVMLIDDPYELATAGSEGVYSNLDALRYKYAGLVNTDPIAAPVAAALHVPLGTVLDSVSAQAPEESLLMVIVATTDSAREAQEVSQATANQVTAYVRSEDQRFDIPVHQQFSLTTINPASAPVAQRPSRAKALTLGIALALVGFAVGFGALQLVRFLR